MSNANTIDIEATAKRIMDKEVLYLANELVEVLYQNDNLIDDLIPCLSSYVTCEECHGEGCDQCDHGEVYREVLQHWIVSDWLAEKLENAGEPVARDVAGVNIWGRTCCGQSIDMDGAILNLARSIEGVR